MNIMDLYRDMGSPSWLSSINLGINAFIVSKFWKLISNDKSGVVWDRINHIDLLVTKDMMAQYVKESLSSIDTRITLLSSDLDNVKRRQAEQHKDLSDKLDTVIKHLLDMKLSLH